MKILYCGDVVGRSGRTAILDHVPPLKKSLGLDFIVINGENAAHGFGITRDICEKFFAVGIDVITTGNHIWDQKEIIPYIDNEKRLLRPINYSQNSVGRGVHVYELFNGKKVVVVNVMGRIFMEPVDDPFRMVQEALAPYNLGKNVDAIIIDVHGEASSEKQAMAHMLDGKVSLVVGSHTHVPTADGRILGGGTAFQTDAGMTGDYNSVIGMVKENAINKLTISMSKEYLKPASGEGTLCGVFIETDNATGLGKAFRPIRIGGALFPSLPDKAI